MCDETGGYERFIQQGLNNEWIAPWLQKAGYKTYYTGKLMNDHTKGNYDKPFPGGLDGNDFLVGPGMSKRHSPHLTPTLDSPPFVPSPLLPSFSSLTRTGSKPTDCGVHRHIQLPQPSLPTQPQPTPTNSQIRHGRARRKIEHLHPRRRQIRQTLLHHDRDSSAALNR